MKTLLALLLGLALTAQASADPVTLQSGNTSANCHGFTFQGGTTVVDQFAVEGGTDNVGQVIRNGYTPVDDPSTARPGDIIVYDDPNAPSHTGIVVGVQDGRPVVVSKWGQRGDVKLHDPGEYGHAGDADWRIYRRKGALPDPVADSLARELMGAGDADARRRAADRLLPMLQRWNRAASMRLSAVIRSTSTHEEDGERTVFLNGTPAPGCPAK